MRSTRPKNSARRARLRPVALCLCLLPLALNSCQGNVNGGGGASQTPPAVAPTAQATTARPAFDAERAFQHVKRMVETGPRPAGSAELARVRAYLSGELTAAGLKVSSDEFDARTPVGVRRMVNLTAELPGKSQEVIIVASHYDTKLYKEFRFVGANDGGSSTGVLVEIARSLAASGRPSEFTYWFVFFDGEEAFCGEWDECRNPEGPDNTYGSRRMVARLRERRELQRVRALILLDMIGYSRLRLRQDDLGTQWLSEIVWRTGRELGHGAVFADGREPVGGDDHEPFLRAGVPAIDIIQLTDYPHWHTAEDTLDKISAESLRVVGETVLASLPRVEERLARERR
jgi:glutaminyl-peptide cyclotransferase